jgi:small conductance mechanosensitive channel
MSSIGDLLFEFLSETININTYISQLIIKVTVVILWIVIGLILIKVTKKIIFKVMRVDKNNARSITVAKLLSSISKYVIWFIVVLMILGELNVNVTPFIASAGVIGLAVGFGAQELVKDFISGFFIIFEDAFNVGDIVEIDGFKGSVLSLGLRITIIENWRGERKIISNGNLGSIINFSKNNSIAVIDFGVGYDTNLAKLNKLLDPFLKELEKKYDEIIETPQFLGVTKLADSSINMMIIAKTNSMKHLQVERDIRKDLVEYFNKHNIEIPFPQMVIHNA